MNTTVLVVLLVAANILGAGMIVPQVVRMMRRRTTDGVSGSWLGVGLGINSWWIAYVVHEALWGMLIVSVAAVVLYGMLAYLYAGIVGGRSWAHVASGIAAGSVAPAISLAFGGWGAAGLALGLSYGLQFAPAAVQSVRATNLDGIAPLTWMMAWCEAVVWLTYGNEIGDRALIVGGIGGALMASVILVRIVMLRKLNPIAAESVVEWSTETETDIAELAGV